MNGTQDILRQSNRAYRSFGTGNNSLLGCWVLRTQWKKGREGGEGRKEDKEERKEERNGGRKEGKNRGGREKRETDRNLINIC